jgi:hypothetical protein
MKADSHGENSFVFTKIPSQKADSLGKNGAILAKISPMKTALFYP